MPVGAVSLAVRPTRWAVVDIGDGLLFPVSAVRRPASGGGVSARLPLRPRRERSRPVAAGWQARAMTADFGGATAAYYARYRRGYPPAVVDAIVAAFGLDGRDLVVDLGCGTGQLTVPLAGRVGTVVGVDPEPDMLALARSSGRRAGLTNAAWLLGADSDVPALRRLCGDGGLAAVTIAVAVHWMDRDALFPAIRPLLRPGGGVAVVTNGTPLWLQDTDWSRALRRCLQEWTGRAQDGACQTDTAGRARNSDALERAGYRVSESHVDYHAEMSVDDVVGGLFSAMSTDRLAAPDRDAFADRLRARLEPYRPIVEHVRVHLQFGHA